jgi:hypothetical protein
MNIFISTFEAVAMLLIIGVVGFLLLSRKMVPEKFFSLLSPLALEIALPSLVFVNIITNFNPIAKPDWWKLPLWWLFFIVIALIITVIGMIISKKNSRGEFGLSLFYQNGIFFPLAIITGVYGINSEYTVDLFFFVMFYATFFFNTYFFFFRSEKVNIKWRKIFHPVFIMTVLAIIIKLIGVENYIPSFIVSALRMLGNMAIPLLMLILGGNMLVDFRNVGKIYISEIIKFILFKNIIMPVIFLLIILKIRPSFNIALILMLEASVPPVTAIPIVTEREGGNRSLVNQFMIVSFLFSLISIPFMLFLFSKFF